MRRKTITYVLLCLIFFTTFSLYAKEYSVALIQIPTVDTLVNFFKALAEATGNRLNIQIVPGGRAMHLIESKQVDFMFPATIGFDSKKNAQLKFDFSGALISKSVMVLYTNKDKPLNISDLKAGNSSGYYIETASSLAELWDFTPNISNSIDGSLQKISKGLIDGLVYTQFTGDILLRKLELKNIKRQLYGITYITCALQKGAKDGEIDKMLIMGLDTLKRNGKYEEIMARDNKLIENYDNWQP